jgi:hypothetical protein
MRCWSLAPTALAAYDLATGQRRWSVDATVPAASTLTAVGDDLVVRAEGSGFKRTTWVAHRVADGAVAWRHPREVVDELRPSDDGRRVYLHRIGTLIELDAATGAATPLDANTASATWQVRLGDGAITVARRDGTGAPLRIPSADDVVDVDLAGDWLVEARLGAPTVELHDLIGGPRAPGVQQGRARVSHRRPARAASRAALRRHARRRQPRRVRHGHCAYAGWAAVNRQAVRGNRVRRLTAAGGAARTFSSQSKGSVS